MSEDEWDKARKWFVYKQKAEESLLACPFCEERPALLESPPGPEIMQYHIDCRYCELSMSSECIDYDHEDKAKEKELIKVITEKWNKRV